MLAPKICWHEKAKQLWWLYELYSQTYAVQDSKWDSAIIIPLTNVIYTDCQRIVGDYHMKTKTATMEIVAMWFNQSPQLTWEDVVDTLFCYGLVNRSTIELANRHKVNWEPVYSKRQN